LIIVLDAVQDPGNAGAIVRVAEAFGATGAVFLNGSVSPYNPKCLRASAGSTFRMPIVTGLTEEGHLLQVASYDLFERPGGAGLAVGQAKLSESCAIVIGGGRVAACVPSSLRGPPPSVIPTTGVESLKRCRRGRHPTI
jgi:TrmH family RNA methyltransferase